MSRILRDLRRPASHEAAWAALLDRIGSDPDTQSWAAGLIDTGAEWQLALHAHSGLPDAEVVAAWRAAAQADKAATEAEAAAALRARIAAANAAEGNDDGGLDLRPPGG